MKKEVKFKYVIGIFLLFIVLGIIFSFSIYREYYSVEKINIDNLKEDKNVMFNIDSVENNLQEKICIIRGWAFKKGKNLETVETYVAIKNVDTLETYKVNTVKEERKDVTAVFNDSHNYDNSGFIARIDKSAIRNKGRYEICILYLSDNNNSFVETNYFFDVN